MTFEPFIGFQFIRLDWTAQNGYLQYPPETSSPYTPWSPSTPKTPVYGTGIIYTQTYLVPAVGLKGELPVTQRLTFTVSFLVSPYLWCFDKDSHIFRQLDFYSTMQGGLLLEPRLSAAYRIGGTTSVVLDVLYRHISQLVGDSYEVGTGANGYTPVPPSTQPGPGQQSVTFVNAAGPRWMS